MNIEHTARQLRHRMREAKNALINKTSDNDALRYELEAAYGLMGLAAYQMEVLQARITNLTEQ